MISREQIINSMCMTKRHDFGLIKEDPQEHQNFAENLQCGMYRHERDALWREMAQIFDNCIWPFMTFRNLKE